MAGKFNVDIDVSWVCETCGRKYAQLMPPGSCDACPTTKCNTPSPDTDVCQGGEVLPDASRVAASGVVRDGAEVSKPLDVQVGGDHYKKYTIQPTEYCQVNKLNWCESNIVAYATRWQDKGGIQDLQKIKHYVDLLIQIEGLDENQSKETK